MDSIAIGTKSWSVSRAPCAEGRVTSRNTDKIRVTLGSSFDRRWTIENVFSTSCERYAPRCPWASLAVCESALSLVLDPEGRMLNGGDSMPLPANW